RCYAALPEHELSRRVISALGAGAASGAGVRGVDGTASGLTFRIQPMAIDLTSFTTARVALGRTGNSLPTAELLRFQLDHARARDAVYTELDPRELPGPHVLVHSAASDRRTYLRRPDLGRVLSDDSRTQLPRGEYDAAIVMADGLSPLAAHRHAAPLLD